MFLHVVQATTVCEGERSITVWNLFPIQSITSVIRVGGKQKEDYQL